MVVLYTRAGDGWESEWNE